MNMMTFTRQLNIGALRDYDPRGPAGPTAFWKISDKNQPNYGNENDLLAEMDEIDGDYESNHDGEDPSDDDDDAVPAGLTVPGA